MKIKLNHNCGAPKATGMPGDIVDTDEATAKELVSRGGATFVNEPPPEESPKPKSAPAAKSKKDAD